MFTLPSLSIDSNSVLDYNTNEWRTNTECHHCGIVFDSEKGYQLHHWLYHTTTRTRHMNKHSRGGIFSSLH